VHFGPREKQLRGWAIQLVLNGVPAVADALQPSVFNFVEDFKVVADAHWARVLVRWAGLQGHQTLPSEGLGRRRLLCIAGAQCCGPGAGELVQRVELALVSQALSGHCVFEDASREGGVLQVARGPVVWANLAAEDTDEDEELIQNAEAQSDTATETETTNIQAPSEATEDDEAPGAPDAAEYEGQGGHFVDTVQVLMGKAEPFDQGVHIPVQKQVQGEAAPTDSAMKAAVLAEEAAGAGGHGGRVRSRRCEDAKAAAGKAACGGAAGRGACSCR
jgi:hypothetical protein